MKYPEFKSLSIIDLTGLGTVAPMTKQQFAAEIGLNKPGIEWDGALPKDWLENFLTFTKQHEQHRYVNYGLTISTTFWVYYESDPIGRPVSGCTEVQEAIDHFIGVEGADN